MCKTLTLFAWSKNLEMGVEVYFFFDFFDGAHDALISKKTIHVHEECIHVNNNRPKNQSCAFQAVNNHSLS